MANGIGGMLASTGTNIGQQVGGAYRGLGQDIAGMLTGVGDGIVRRRQEREAKEAEELLRQFGDNPEKLRELANQYQLQGKNEVAEVFNKMANMVAKKQVAGLEVGGEAITARAEAARAEAERVNAELANMRAGQMAGLEAAGARATERAEAARASVSRKDAIMEAADRGDRTALRGLQSGAISPEDYFKQLMKEKPTKSQGITTVKRKDGSVSILDKETGDLISTLPPTQKGEGDQEASLNLIAQTTQFINEIDNLIDPGFFESGFVGGVTQVVPGMPAYDREKELLSIRARLGFDQINEMKRLAAESGASGTGLGQISNIEFMSLQSTVDAIYTGMGKDAQNKALENIKKHLLNVQKLASGVAASESIDWDAPEYAAVGYAKDPETGQVYYAPDGRNGTMYVLKNGKFEKLGI